MHKFFKNGEYTNPFPINHRNYNKHIFKNNIIFFIPINNDKPFVLAQNNKHMFLYINNKASFAYHLLNNVYFEDIEDVEILIEELTDFIDFKDSEHGVNISIVCNNKIKGLYYKKENGLNILFRFFRGTLDTNNKYDIDFQIDLKKTKKKKPLEQKKIKGVKINKYYYFNNENKKLHLSFDIEEDLPFEVTENNNIIIKDFLIPMVKTKRTLCYKPSQLFYKNGILDKYKYFFGEIDKTDDVQSILNKHNIINPENHHYNENEIKDISNIFK